MLQKLNQIQMYNFQSVYYVELLSPQIYLLSYPYIACYQAQVQSLLLYHK